MVKKVKLSDEEPHLAEAVVKGHSRVAEREESSERG